MHVSLQLWVVFIQSLDTAVFLFIFIFIVGSELPAKLCNDVWKICSPSSRDSNFVSVRKRERERDRSIADMFNQN